MIALKLTIDNEESLPDGGPLSYTLTGKRGIDIGRDKHLDWVLPDPSRAISGKHCEIRYRDGGYWLHDVSSNGTFVNGSASRPVAPLRLRNGDRLEIGRYIISVQVAGDDTAEPRDWQSAPAAAVAAPGGDLWGIDEETAPVEPVGSLRAIRAKRPAQANDFIDSVTDIPAPQAIPRPVQPSAPVFPPAVKLDWDVAPPAPEAPPPASPPGEPAFQIPAAAAPVPPPPPPEPSPVVVERSVTAPAAEMDFIRLFERGAGLPERSLADRNPAELAEDLGRMMLAVTAELKQLMQARSQTKGAMRSSQHTMVQALENNPIPFAPTPEDALRIMLAAKTASYLQGEAALKKTFETLKTHQMDTFVSMQGALDGLLQQLDPAAIDKGLDADSGIGKIFGARKARLWDVYMARWQALAETHPEGIRGAFMSLFTTTYDRRSSKK